MSTALTLIAAGILSGWNINLSHKFCMAVYSKPLEYFYIHTHSNSKQVCWTSHSFRTVKIVLVMRYKVQSFSNTVWSTASCFRRSVLTFGPREAIMEKIYKACKNFPIISVFIPSSASEITFLRSPLVRRKFLQDTEEKS